MRNTEPAPRPRFAEDAIDAVLLDLDGTLVDSLDEFEIALGHMLRALNLPAVQRASIATAVGRGSEHLVRTMLREALGAAGKSNTPQAVDDQLDAAMALYFAGHEAAGHDKVRIYAGVLDGLRELQAKHYPMALVTNKPARLAVPLLSHTGLDRFLAFAYTGDSFEKRKPDPHPLLMACERLAAAPERTLMIGDSANDAAAARAAGCAVVLMRYGYNHGEPVETVDADGYFDAITEVAAVLPPRLASQQQA